MLARLEPSEVGVSVITLGELYEGAFKSPNPQAHLTRLHSFLEPYPPVTLDAMTMRIFGELRFFLRRRGQSIEDFDLMIAVTALRHDLTLLTFNRRHFERIPDLRLYQPDAG